MSEINGVKFQIFVDGVQTGHIGRWKHIPMMVASLGEVGSDDEKFEVLSVIRKTYNPTNENDIRGDKNQTPSQVGRSEGFTELKYRRAVSSALQVEIVKVVMPYRHFIPKSKFRIINWKCRAD